jgi:hypothetical protein
MDDWIKSREKHVIKNQNDPNYKGNWLKVNKDRWRSRREHCEKDMIDYFKNRQKDFLIIKICDGEGWNELCNFLDVDIPNKPFPYKNRTIES